MLASVDIGSSHLLTLLYGLTAFAIPRIGTTSPGQRAERKGFYKEENGPTDDGVVVEACEKVQHAHCVTDALGHGTNSAPDCQATTREVLAERHFQVEDGQAAKDEHDRVGNEEGACEIWFDFHGKLVPWWCMGMLDFGVCDCRGIKNKASVGFKVSLYETKPSEFATLTAAVLVADVGKTPNVTQINGEPNDCQ